jgi:hypothetical protein
MDGTDADDPTEPAETGGAGGICTDHRSVRSDARMVARLLSLGVVPVEVAEAVLKRGFVLAGNAKSARNYRAAMSVIQGAAKLGLDAVRKDAPSVAVQVNAPAAQVQVIRLPDNGREAVPADTPPRNGNGKAAPRVEGPNGHGTNGHTTNGNGRH